MLRAGEKKLDLEKIRFKGDFQKLLHIAQSPKAPHRIEALRQLGIMHTNKVIPIAIQLFRDPDPTVQTAASQVLVKLGVSAVPSLITAYKTDSEHIARWIDSTLLSIGPDAADMLIHALPKIDEFSQERVSYILILMGPSILPKLVHALSLHTGDGKRIIESIIENIGMPSAPYLIDALKDPNEEIRSLAAAELIIAGPKIVPDLLHSCSDDTPAEKELKYYIISQIGTPALDSLYDCIKSADPATSAMAIDAFVMFKDSATAPFIAGLFEKDLETNQSAENAIVRIGGPIVQALIDEIPRRNESEQEQIVRVLSKIGQSALPAMVNALQHPSVEVTENMVTGIAATMGVMVSPLLLEKVIDFEEHGEQNIKRVFQLIGRSTLAPLEEAITWPNEKIALFSLEMITDIDPLWAIDPLITTFNHSKQKIRDMAVSCLLQVGTPAVPRLIGVLDSNDPDVVALATKTIIAIGDAAVPYLVDAYGKSYGPPGDRITDILQQIGNGSLDSVVQHLSADEDSNTISYYAGSAVIHSGRDDVAILIESFHEDDNPEILAETLAEIGSMAMLPLVSALLELNGTGMSGTPRFLGLMQCLGALARANDEQMHVLFGLTDKESINLVTSALNHEGEPVLDSLLRSLMSWRGETPALAYEICSRMRAAAIEKLHAAIETIPPGDLRKIPPLQLLVSLNDSSSSSLLLKCLEDPSEEVRLAATRDMGTFGRGALKSLEKAANDTSEAVRIAAVASMGEIGIPALDSLFRALKSDESSIRAVAVDGIAKIGEPAQIMLVQELADKDRDVRKNVVRLLEAISWQPKYTIDKLDYLFAAEDWNGLIKMGSSAIDVLEQGLKDDDEEIHSKSEEALQQIREDLPRDNKIIRGVHDDDK